MSYRVTTFIIFLFALLGLSFSVWEPFEQRRLYGLKLVLMNSSATAVAMKEVDGLLVLANLVQVELYLEDRVIARYNYRDLLGVEGVARYEALYIEADTANSRIFIIHPEHGIGTICYGCQVSKDASFATKCLWENAGTDTNIKDQGFYKEAKNGANPKQRDSLCRQFNEEVWVSQSDSKFIYIKEGEDQCSLFTGISLRDIDRDEYLSTDSTWVFIAATKDLGLMRMEVDRAGLTLKRRTQLQYLLPNGFELRHVRSVHYLDRYKSVLIGSVGEGVLLWSHLSDEVFRPIRASETETSEIRRDNKYNHIWTVCPADNKGFLSGNDIGAIHWIDSNDNTHSVFQAERSFQVMHIAAGDGDGHFFAAMRNEDGNNKIYHLQWNSRENNKHLESVDSLSFIEKDKGKVYILHHRKDTLWMGTDKGLFFIPTSSSRSSWKNGGLSKYKETNGAVRFISTDSLAMGKGFFFGGSDSLLCFRSERGNTLNCKVKTIDGKSIKNISYVLPLGSKKYIVTTRGDGFFYCELELNGKTFKALKHFDPKRELIAYTENGGVAPILTVYGGVKYEEETVWLSTNFGLLELDLASKKFYRYDHNATGLPQSEGNTLAFARLNDSLAVWGTLDGIIKVNMAAAIRVRKEKAQNKIKPQIWRMLPISKPDSDIVSKIEYIYEKIDSRGISDLYESQMGYFLVKPDYFLLNKELVTVQHHNGDSSWIYSGLTVSFAELAGEKKRPDAQLSAHEITFHIDGEKVNGFQLPNKKRQAWLGLVIVILLGVFSVNVSEQRREEADRAKEEEVRARRAEAEAQRSKQELKQQQHLFEQRQKLFRELGEKLEQAKGFQGIQEAFMTISEEEMRVVLSATKISLYQYRPGEDCLQLIAHWDDQRKEGEDNTLFQNFSHVKFALKVEKDANYPITYLWNNRNTIPEGRLVANRAWKDFYNNKLGLQDESQRPKPKRGGKVDSFIFQIIGVEDSNEMPFGVIAIQNEKPGAYQDEKEVEQYAFLMKTIGRLAYFKVGEIEQTIANQLFNTRSRLYRNRLEAHFLGDLIANPKKIIESHDIQLNDSVKLALKSFGDGTKKLFKRIYATDSLMNLEEEVKLCATYITLKNGMDSQSIEFKSAISDSAKKINIPSLVLLNLVHNSYKAIRHGDSPKGEIEISANIADNDILIVSIRDTGPGFSTQNLHDLRSYPVRNLVPAYKSSLYLIIDLLMYLDSTIGGNSKIDFSNIQQGRGAQVLLNLSVQSIELYCSVIEDFSKPNN